jgi:beta-lactam-binding protein with PASTA domain
LYWVAVKAAVVINVPDLVGMTLNEARTYLSTMGISIGSVAGMEEIKDSAKLICNKANT